MFGMNSKEGNEAVRVALEDIYGIEDIAEAKEIMRHRLTFISLDHPEVSTHRVRRNIFDFMGPDFEEVLD
jgi:hypothetical protein